MVNSFVLTPLYTQLAMCHALSERKPSDALWVSKFAHGSPRLGFVSCGKIAIFVREKTRCTDTHPIPLPKND